MVCPECGELVHRSHSRNFRETLIKKASRSKIYRCRECGWRGMASTAGGNAIGGRLRSILLWIAGLIIALLIGIYAVYDMQSSTVP